VTAPRRVRYAAPVRPDDLRFAADAFAPPATRPPVTVTWLGTAGFAIEHDGTTLLIDPYVTRASLWDCVRAPLRSDAAAVARWTPRADAIVAGHTHFDHALDVPAIARATGATVYGSRSCAALCHIAGVPGERVVDVESAMRGEPVRAQVGPFALRFLPSAHSAFLFGRVPYPGEISDCDQVPMRTGRYRCGAVFGVEITVAGRRLYHLGSANLVDAHRAADVDLLLMCVAGWTSTRDFPTRVLSAFSPGAILLSHWDDFFRPMEAGARPLPALAFPRLVDALGAANRDLRLGTVPIGGAVAL
jgi:L-ascorbate metabolism protein UlaG (beta-lactamase superfamily)